MALPIKGVIMSKSFAMAIITGVTLMIICLLSEQKIDCNEPSTWSTSAGVTACAVHEGE